MPEGTVGEKGFERVLEGWVRLNAGGRARALGQMHGSRKTMELGQTWRAPGSGGESGPGTQWEAAVNLGGEECGIRSECGEGFQGSLSTLLPFYAPPPRYGVLLGG